MKAVFLTILVILAVSEGVEVQEARNVELACDKEDGCLKDCDLLFQPSTMRDETHLKYQEKHNKCIQSATAGDNCERNAEIKNCFIAGESEVNDLIEDDFESHTIYWHKTINLRK
uniref:Salivary OBP-7 family protein n=1 Tax=Simulium guianense TaxID=445764 RepID=F5GTV7_SIMGU